jgi:hypothetical protein
LERLAREDIGLPAEQSKIEIVLALWDAIGAKLVRYSGKLSWPEEKLKLMERYDANKFDALPVHRKADMAQSLFLPADLMAQCVFIKRLTMLGETGKRDACVQCMIESFIESDREGSRLLRPDRIGGFPGGDGGAGLDPQQRTQLVRDALLNEIISLPEPDEDEDEEASAADSSS